MALPTLTLIRHGETEWSRAGKHTGRTDMPLTPIGEAAARRLGSLLTDSQFEQVWTSPLKRAAETCRLAGYGDAARTDADLREWDYGKYEGLTTPEIQATRPGWTVFTHDCPGGETISDVATRVQRVIQQVRDAECNCLVFSSGHLLRVLTACWLGQPPQLGKHLALSTASLSVLGYEHHRERPVIKLWNHTEF